MTINNRIKLTMFHVIIGSLLLRIANAVGKKTPQSFNEMAGSRELTSSGSRSRSSSGFNLEICSSYSNSWLWDLSSSCGNGSTDRTCECNSAAILMSEDLLACPEDSGGPYCPKECEICETCLALLGFSQTTRPGGPRPIFILAAVGGILLGVIAVMAQLKEQEQALGENLMNGVLPPSGDGKEKIELVRVSK